MKQGRNEPCNCGSGKKYKKCCIFKEVLEAAVQEPEEEIFEDMPFDDEDEDEDDGIGMNKLLLRGMINFHKLFLRRKPHIKEYYKIRKLHGEIVDSMVNYYEDGKFEPKTTPVYDGYESKGPRELEIINSSFDFDKDVEVKAFYDMIIYKSAENTNCITEEFIAKNRYRKPEKIELLHSMLNSDLGLFEVTETDIREGQVHFKDVFNGREYKVTDVALSGGPGGEDFYFYTRIITYGGINFTGGPNFIFTKTDPFIQEHISHHKKNYRKEGEHARFLQLYNRFSKNPGVAFVTNTLG